MPYVRTPRFQSNFATEDFVQGISRLSYNEARRLRYPIYKVLNLELNEEGCRTAGEYFRCLVRKEEQLYSSNNIRFLVKDERDLLIAMVENMKLAERAAKLSSCGGMPACLKVLLQTLMMLHKFEYEYDWLLNDLYTIFIGIAERHTISTEADCGSCLEIKARMFCIYAIYLGKRVENIEKCFKYFAKSLDLCRGEIWSGTDLSDSINSCTLHEFVVSKLGKTLIGYARAFAHVNPRLGIDMAQKAIEAIAEINRLELKLMLCEAYLVKIRFLVDAKEHHEAMFNINALETRLTPDLGVDYARLIGELFLLKGEYLKLYGKPTKALLKFKQSLLISRKYGLRTNEAQTLLQLGKLYMEYPQGNIRAREALEDAKEIFIELLDNQNRLLVMYLLAKLDVSERFPRLMRLLKKSDNFCDLYKLRQWKYLCKPFWQLPKRSTGFTLPTDSLTQLTETQSLDLFNWQNAKVDDDHFDLDEAESIFAYAPYTEEELRLTAHRVVRVSVKVHDKVECLMEDYVWKKKESDS